MLLLWLVACDGLVFSRDYTLSPLEEDTDTDNFSETDMPEDFKNWLEYWEDLITPPKDTSDEDTSSNTEDTSEETEPQEDPPLTDMSDCTLPVSYHRVSVNTDEDFTRVAYAPNGEYAIILSRDGNVYRYESNNLTQVHVGDDENLDAVEVVSNSEYALVGGWTDAKTPLLYRLDDNGTELVPVATSLSGTFRIKDIQQRPGTDTFVLLSDNADSSQGFAYAHLLTPNWSTDVHTLTFYGATVVDQGAASIAWGKSGDTEIALATSYYLEMMLLKDNVFALHAHEYTGNLRKVVFNKNRTVAWALQWVGTPTVYSWEGSLDSSDKGPMPGKYLSDFNTSPDGYWKVFVGEEGNVWFADSPWTPIDKNKFYDVSIPSFESSPWYGENGTYLNSVSWKPGTCSGLIVGDATNNKSMLIEFTL